MAGFREPIPTITGPGGYFVFLLILAVMWTSKDGIEVVFNWNYAVALVAISIPLSVFVTQVYHALFRLFGFKSLEWIKPYLKGEKASLIEQGREAYGIDVMMDFLVSKKDSDGGGFEICQKQATAYHISNMLFWTSAVFVVLYVSLLVFMYFTMTLPDFSAIGVLLTFVFTVCLAVVFRTARKTAMRAWEMINSKLLQDKTVQYGLREWLGTKSNTE